MKSCSDSGDQLNYNERGKPLSNHSEESDLAVLISVTVNGEARTVPAGMNVREFLTHLEIPTDRVAVELNREIVRKAEWETAVVAEGAALEIVHFVGGG